MKIVCPECSQKCELGDEYDGVTVECPQCGKEFVARKPVPLIVCPACQGRVSVMAEACPHCGHPILPEVLKQEPSQIVFSENHHPNRYLPFFYVDWKYLVLMVIMFILVGFWIYGDLEQHRRRLTTFRKLMWHALSGWSIFVGNGILLELCVLESGMMLN